MHTGERPYQCEHCHLAFKQTGHLNRHLRIHTGERPFQCHLCPMDFTRKYLLVRHLETHTGKDSPSGLMVFTPVLTVMAVSEKTKLVSVPLHHGQPDPPGSDEGLHLKRCLVCGYTTPFKQRMQCHQRIHTGERPHKRRYCSRAFKQTAHLTEHVHIHTGERPFQCHLCPMNFTRQSTLMRHLAIHRGRTALPDNACTCSERNSNV
ncbi:hypothetical protein HPB51_029256 [Rhipicephalus microplus]|uniref:C2H2-type domain-containing protein n=1 Tax=Rhipicephalus microplus TaxID=6941 RepID=A0A9J6CVE0_RHIMP|nr:hypothetical protein HPB51_029256 [Rhipicephalus microplus]